MSDSSPSQSRLLTIDAAPEPRAEVEKPLELAADAPQRSSRGSAGPAGCARSTDRTGRRSSRSHRRRRRSAARRHAAAGATRRSGRGGRHGANRRSDRSRYSPQIGRPVASRSARPGVVACRMPRHSSSSRRSAPPSRGACRRHRAVRRGVCPEAAAQVRSFTNPMLSCGLRCRPPWPGGSVIDARLNRRPTGRSGTILRGILIAIPIVILLVTVLTGGRWGVVHRGRVQLLRAGPARPRGGPQRPPLRAADDRL